MYSPPFQISKRIRHWGLMLFAAVGVLPLERGKPSWFDPWSKVERRSADDFPPTGSEDVEGSSHRNRRQQPGDKDTVNFQIIYATLGIIL